MLRRISVFLAVLREGCLPLNPSPGCSTRIFPYPELSECFVARRLTGPKVTPETFSGCCMEAFQNQSPTTSDLNILKTKMLTIRWLFRHAQKTQSRTFLRRYSL